LFTLLAAGAAAQIHHQAAAGMMFSTACNNLLLKFVLFCLAQVKLREATTKQHMLDHLWRCE
jgi:hypothetical protein